MKEWMKISVKETRRTLSKPMKRLLKVVTNDESSGRHFLPQHVPTYPKHLERRTWIWLRFLYPLVYAEVKKTIGKIVVNENFEKKSLFFFSFGGYSWIWNISTFLLWLAIASIVKIQKIKTRLPLERTFQGLQNETNRDFLTFLV